ncbi:CC0125/CC1285 family lipoprotein [Caulobacter segnis]
MTLRTATLVAALATVAGLSACATATPYQPNIAGQSASGGFSDLRLEIDRYRVSFAGNTLTSRETVERYLLYRAAELTTQQGYDWFETADRRTDRNARTVVDVDPFMRPGFGYGAGYGAWRPSWRYFGPRYGGWRSWDPYWGDPFFTNRAEVRTIQKFEATAEIVLHKGPKPAGDPSAYDAREIMDSLGASIQRPA